MPVTSGSYLEFREPNDDNLFAVLTVNTFREIKKQSYPCTRHKGVCERGGIPPLILNLCLRRIRLNLGIKNLISALVIINSILQTFLAVNTRRSTMFV